MAIKVTPANVSDNEEGINTPEELKENVPRLKKNTLDNGYKLTFTERVKDNFGWEVEIELQRRTLKTRIYYGICPSKKSVAGRKEF